MSVWISISPFLGQATFKREAIMTYSTRIMLAAIVFASVYSKITVSSFRGMKNAKIWGYFASTKVMWKNNLDKIKQKRRSVNQSQEDIRTPEDNLETSTPRNN
jgi:hypothetical protein